MADLRAYGALALLGVALAACAPVAAPPPSTSCAVPAGFEDAAPDLTRLANAFRAETALPPLAATAALTAAAQAHACDMAATGNFSHTGSGGTEIGDRIERQGYAWRFAAENIAFGQPFAESTFAGWRASTGHRRNMLSDQAAEIGIGLAASPSGTLYWVMVLAAPR